MMILIILGQEDRYSIFGTDIKNLVNIKLNIIKICKKTMFITALFRHFQETGKTGLSVLHIWLFFVCF